MLYANAESRVLPTKDNPLEIKFYGILLVKPITLIFKVFSIIITFTKTAKSV